MAICLTTVLRPRPLAGLLAALLGLALPETGSAQTAADVLRTRIEQGYQQRNLASIEAARVDLLSLAATPNRSAADVSSAAYFAAYARFRQALSVASDRRSARGYLEDCISELREVVGHSPAHAEARALLGSCYGMSTLYSATATVTRGLKARRQMAEARRLAPDNPWVVMQDGLADWATPRLFGGDRNLALTKLERATQLFVAAAHDGSEVAAWGAVEAFQQLGSRYQEMGRPAAAKSAFERGRALKSAPLSLAAAGS